MRWRVVLAGTTFALVLGAASAWAQGVPTRGASRPTPRATAPTPGQRADSARRDSLGRDTTAADTTLVHWATADSAMQALLQRPGYLPTRYQSDTANFSAQAHVLTLLPATGGSAAVRRQTQTVVSDSAIYYSEQSHSVTVGGHYVLSDPSSHQADVHGFGVASYNLTERYARVTNARFAVDNGQAWYLTARTAALVGDSSSVGGMRYYARKGTLTSCSDSIPDYYFAYNEVKRNKNTIVVAPAVMYVKDVPVLWLPFMFTDSRPGRHSGILTPRVGVSDIVRNNPGYHRDVEHLGYFWAPSDYVGFSTWLDWRSSVGDDRLGDQGWTKFNGQWDYAWMNRFLSGSLASSYETETDGSTNTAITWMHNQKFPGLQSSLVTDVNWVTNTTLQRRNTFDPVAALATITSNANYQEQFGQTTVSIGGSRQQFPGRKQVNETFPTFSLTTPPVSLAGGNVVWTPGLNFTESRSQHLDQPGFAERFFTSPTGTLDSTALNQQSATSSLSFDTPLKIFGYNLNNSFAVRQMRNDFPVQVTLYDMKTGDSTGSRIFASQYRTEVDWNPVIELPALMRNAFNMTPSVSLQNVDPGAFWVESERTAGHFVHQTKRPTFGLSMTPTVYGLFPGFGPFARFRHSLNPSITFGYAPAASVDTTYLAAFGRTKAHYLGGLRQNSISFGLNQALEAKIKPRPGSDTSATSRLLGAAAPVSTVGAVNGVPSENGGTTLKLLSLDLTSVTYDFERASAVHRRSAGFTNSSFGYTVRSDLLPGLDVTVGYSLFQGDPISDTAVFKPYRENVAASLNFNNRENPLMVLTRLFGKAVPQAQASSSPSADQSASAEQQAEDQRYAAVPVAGNRSGGSRFLMPPSEGWSASFTFSSSRPRPPVGGNVIDFDPRTRCRMLSAGNEFYYEACLAQEAANPNSQNPVNSLTAGGPAYRIPAQSSLGANINFQLTPKWTALWQTSYDFQQRQFASQMVSLQRDMHDFRAIFGFSQAPNGNFAFNFSIGLKADPDLKFDYNKSTVRSTF